MLVGVDRCAILLADGERWRLAAYAGGDDPPNSAAEQLLPEVLEVDDWPGFRSAAR